MSKCPDGEKFAGHCGRRPLTGLNELLGAVALIGNVAPEVPLPLQTAVTRELTLAGSCASAGEYPACLDLIARGAVRLDPLLSAVAPLAEGAAWFARLREGAGDLMKVVLVP